MEGHITVRQAAERMGLSRGRVQQLIQQERLHPVREETAQGSIYWLKPEDVDACEIQVKHRRKTG